MNLTDKWKKVDPKNIIQITHKFCIDGMTCAGIVRAAFGQEVQLHREAYHQEFPVTQLTDETVLLITDFSYSAGVLNAVSPYVKEIVMLDHHDRTEEDVKGYHENPKVTYVHSDVNCGATLTYRELFGSDFIHSPFLNEQFLDHVERYDTFTNKTGETEALSEALWDVPADTFKDPEYWSTLLTSGQDAYLSLLKRGQDIIDFRTRYIDRVINELKYMTGIFLGKKFAIVNTNMYRNELAYQLAMRKNLDFTITWYATSDNMISFSFRSPGRADVGEIAKRFGGGGRANTAGYRANLTDGLGMIGFFSGFVTTPEQN